MAAVVEVSAVRLALAEPFYGMTAMRNMRTMVTANVKASAL